MKLTPT